MHHDYVDVEVQDTDLCTRYCARVGKEYQDRSFARSGCRDVWLPAGIRPINNLVDITNYVMAGVRTADACI